MVLETRDGGRDSQNREISENTCKMTKIYRSSTFLDRTCSNLVQNGIWCIFYSILKKSTSGKYFENLLQSMLSSMQKLIVSFFF